MVREANQCTAIVHNANNSTTTVASELLQASTHLDAVVAVAIRHRQIAHD